MAVNREGVVREKGRQLCFASRQPQNATNVAQMPDGKEGRGGPRMDDQGARVWELTLGTIILRNNNDLWDMMLLFGC